jgi:hypothetical protein
VGPALDRPRAVILRTWLAFAVLGSAVAFAYRGDWALAAALIVVLLAPAIRWVRDELAATRTTLRALNEMVIAAEEYGRASRAGVKR